MTAGPDLEVTCPHCSVAVGDHTLRGWQACLEGAGVAHNLPYQEIEGGPLVQPGAGDRILVGAVDVHAVVMDTAIGRLPVLAFTFHAPGLTPMSSVPTPTYALVGDAQMMIAVAELVTASARGAIKAAS